MERREKIDVLRRQGVEIPAPETLEIGDEVKLDQIRGPGTILHTGTKLYGERSMILAGTRIGFEAPATLDNCAVGRDVKLGGGCFSDAVFLDSVVMGSGAQVRSGTLMEEEANGAHTVGLKQTILLPFVTLGSLVNFCDVLMAGGTSRRDHSEVGSSFIHFNFTPFGRSGDKATPSLIGDVPRGVMLRSKRIFLGGQGGLVGPVHMEYGTMLAAGFVYRRDHGPDELVVGEKLSPRVLPFNPLRYGRILEKVGRNLTYIGNLVALWHWYEQVRLPLVAEQSEKVELFRRGQAMVVSGIGERIKRLGQIASYMEDSIAELEKNEPRPRDEIDNQRQFFETWDVRKQSLESYSELGQTDTAPFESFRNGLDRVTTRKSYIDVIKSLDDATVDAGSKWMASVVDAVRFI